MHRRLLGHAPVPEPGCLVRFVPRVHRCRRIGFGQCRHELIEPFVVPIDQAIVWRLDRRRSAVKPPFPNDLLLLTMHGPGVRHDIADGPPRAARNIGLEPVGRDPSQRLALAADGRQILGELHGATLPRVVPTSAASQPEVGVDGEQARVEVLFKCAGVHTLCRAHSNPSTLRAVAIPRRRWERTTPASSWVSRRRCTVRSRRSRPSDGSERPRESLRAREDPEILQRCAPP